MVSDLKTLKKKDDLPAVNMKQFAKENKENKEITQILETICKQFNFDIA